jgi:hypothetical protein
MQPNKLKPLHVNYYSTYTAKFCAMLFVFYVKERELIEVGKWWLRFRTQGFSLGRDRGYGIMDENSIHTL